MKAICCNCKKVLEVEAEFGGVEIECPVCNSKFIAKPPAVAAKEKKWKMVTLLAILCIGNGCLICGSGCDSQSDKLDRGKERSCTEKESEAGASQDERYQDAVEHYKAKNYAESVKLFKELANQGHAPAQVSLGWSYAQGYGIPKDIKQAVYWYQKSADQGYAAAQYNLGLCYALGKGVPKDIKQAVYWYQKSADQGYAAAQYNLGLCYAFGKGVPKDIKQAVYWYQKSADQGHPGAKEALKKLKK